jgi:hypothetical protein
VRGRSLSALDNNGEDGFHGGMGLLRDDEDDGTSTSSLASMPRHILLGILPRIERVAQGYRDEEGYRIGFRPGVLL